MRFLRRTLRLAGLWCLAAGSAWAQAPTATFPEPAHAPPLSSQGRVSLLTEAPGTALYSAFGHSAFRITDPELGIDYVFNYGVFDFERPGFYLNFARGRLDYQLAVYPYPYLEESAVRSGRSLYEQVLNLSPAQGGRLLALLMQNYRPEYREYRYDFFYDNCATRLRDILDRAAPGAIDWHEDSLTVQRSFRQMTDTYLEREQPWGDFGIDLGLGLPADRIPTPRQACFLPDTLAKAFARATIRRAPGEAPGALVRVTVPLVQSPPAAANALAWLSPAALTWGLCLAAVVLTALSWWRLRVGDPVRRVASVFDVLVLPLVGLVGTVIALLWFATDHAATAPNLNLLWAWPLHLVLVPLARWRRPQRLPRWLQWYFWAAAGLALLVAVLWYQWPQMLHHAALPLALLVAVRCGLLALRMRTVAAGRPLVNAPA